MEFKKTSQTSNKSIPCSGSWSEGCTAFSTASTFPEIPNSLSAYYSSSESEAQEESTTLNYISGIFHAEEIYESFGPLGLLIWSKVESKPKFQDITSADELLLVLLECWLEGVNQPKGPNNSLISIVNCLPSKQTLENFLDVESYKEAALYMLLVGIRHEFNLRYQEGEAKTEMQPVMDRFLTSTPSEYLTQASQFLGLCSIS